MAFMVDAAANDSDSDWLFPDTTPVAPLAIVEDPLFYRIDADGEEPVAFASRLVAMCAAPRSPEAIVYDGQRRPCATAHPDEAAWVLA
jgi:hypothetical protein